MGDGLIEHISGVNMPISMQPAHADTVETALKRQEAITLRRGHATYRQIAEHMGITVGYAYKLVADALEEARKDTAETAEQVRQLELDRMDAMSAMLEARMTNAGANVRNRDIETMLRIQERRAKLLGLDSPTELVGAAGGPIQVSTADAGNEFMRRVENLIARVDAGESPESLAAEVRENARSRAIGPGQNEAGNAVTA